MTLPAHLNPGDPLWQQRAARVPQENDPCHQIPPVGTWRLPTQAEFQGLHGAGRRHWLLSNSAANAGHQGRGFGCTPGDVYFDPANGNIIFLRAASYLAHDSGGAGSNWDIWGRYWTTTWEHLLENITPPATVPPGSVAFANAFTGSLGGEGSGGVGGFGVRNAFPIRCVRPAP